MNTEHDRVHSCHRAALPVRVASSVLLIAALLCAADAALATGHGQGTKSGGDRAPGAAAQDRDRDRTDEPSQDRDRDRSDDPDQDRDRDRDRTDEADQDRDRDRSDDPDQDRDRDRDRDAVVDDGLGRPIYGAGLMSDDEIVAFRDQMREATTAEERAALREAHREAMRQRAVERGLALPADPQ